MSKTNFWLVQILMVAILSLVFGSPVFAGPPDHSKGKGGDTSYTSLTNHAGGHSQGITHADGNAAFMSASEPEPEPDPAPAPEECSSATPAGCDNVSCAENGGFWGDWDGDGSAECAF